MFRTMILLFIVLSGCVGAPNRSSDFLGVWFRDNDALSGDVTKDEQLFGVGGRGTYFRDGIPCFGFAFEVHGNLITETADQPNNCDAGKTRSFKFAAVDNRLIQTEPESKPMATWHPMPPAPVEKVTRHICWINRIQKTAVGVNVYFNGSAEFY